MATTVNVLVLSRAVVEHPLVAALTIFAPGIMNTTESVEQESEGEADSPSCDAVPWRLARRGFA
ncbi:hypothetical protein ADK86_36985 [Streptomyces sp. NRRL F-5755]|uniref:hypothetical protein n=1 Tax=Streptomyces sp. NRRL F-5755 TaxID=1519475 RepID=UPI0006AF5AF6|nr:hypothetical protein [Streptomyces sp. NRRL F-5755]KOT87170.1 hypothetical protein ADK86_36985 [Streptomyces sp. NRRL F-5755]